MTKDKATERPWRVEHSLQRGYTVWATVTPTGSMQIAATGHAEFDGANAELIVTAVNERDQLLAGLQEAREVLQMLAQWPSQTCWCRMYRDRGDAHDEKCQRARELMKKLTP